MNPNAEDGLCISGIQRAKNDVKSNKLVFFNRPFDNLLDMRYERELMELCTQKGLEYELLEEAYTALETLTCYEDYMNKVLLDKFGIDFKTKLHRTADSLYEEHIISKMDTIEFWNCDVFPRLTTEKNRTTELTHDILTSDVEVFEFDEMYGSWPIIDIGFTVGLDSTISDFYIRSFFAGRTENESLRNEVFDIAVDHIKNKYPIWVPGKVNLQMLEQGMT
jgi:hypothetical protein